MIGDELEWEIKREGDLAQVKLRGTVAERAKLDVLATELGTPGQIEFDLGEIVRMNSCGVREWINFVRALPSTTATRFYKCSPPFVHQMNLIAGFTGSGTIRTIQIPLICETCNLLDSTTLPVEHGVVPALPTYPCKRCLRPMDFDDFAESYFAFLLR